MGDEIMRETAFPARSSKTVGLVGGLETEAEVVYFGDRILVLVSQGGRLAQWIDVPLSAASPDSVIDSVLPPGLRRGGGGGEGGGRGGGPTSLLPPVHLTPRTLFGAGGEARETLGQLVAAQTGSLLALRDAGDRRTVVVGLGLAPETLRTAVGQERGRGSGDFDADAEADTRSRTIYFDLVELLQRLLG